MKQFFKKKALNIIIPALCMFLSFLSGCTGKQAEPSKRTDTAMGTIVSQTVYVTEQGEAELTEEIMSLIRNLEENMLSWRLPTSEIYQVNTRAARGEEGISLSGELYQIIGTCLTLSAASEGAFDISLGKVIRLWNIDEWSQNGETGYKLPAQEDISEALSHRGSDDVSLQGNSLYLPAGVQLDLGAVGKGIALQRILDYLEEQPDKPRGAVISVGGSVLTYGEKPDGDSWRVGILNPFDTSENLGYLSLTGQWCISTSGDYERFVEVDGIRYHHIIDPATGYPAQSGVSSVTVLTKDGLLSDALSTACFVLGVEKGSRLAEEFDAEVLFVDKSGEMHMSKGMEEYFHLSK